MKSMRAKSEANYILHGSIMYYYYRYYCYYFLLTVPLGWIHAGELEVSCIALLRYINFTFEAFAPVFSMELRLKKLVNIKIVTYLVRKKKERASIISSLTSFEVSFFKFHVLPISLVANHLFIILMSPDPYRLVFPSTAHFLSIGTPIDSIDLVLVPREIDREFPCANVPDLKGGILRG